MCLYMYKSDNTLVDYSVEIEISTLRFAQVSGE